MTPIGIYLTAKGVKPIVKYQHGFKNTYLYGAFLPVDGDAFVLKLKSLQARYFINI